MTAKAAKRPNRSLRGVVRRAARCAPTASAAQIAARLGCHPGTAARHLRSLSRIRESHTEAVRLDAEPSRRGAVEAPSAPMRLLAQLAGDSDHGVRVAVAGHPRSPPQAIARLGRDPVWAVRSRVTDHAVCLDSTMGRLAADTDVAPRLGLADRHDCPPGVLRRLARDTDEDVRRCVAANPNTPPEALARLADDPNERVRQQARIASSISADPASAETWAASADPHTRMRVAACGHCPPEVIARLARDDHVHVLHAVACNPAAPAEVLASLAADASARDGGGSLSLQEYLAENPSTPPAGLAHLTDVDCSTASLLAQKRLAIQEDTQRSA